MRCKTLPTVAAALSLSSMTVSASEPGDFNAAPFGFAFLVAPDAGVTTFAPHAADGSLDTAVDVAPGGAIQVEWRHPRDVHAVRWAFEGPVPAAGDVELSYWYHIWPDNGGGGWMKVDDPFNGRFVTLTADASPGRADDLVIRLKPLDNTENPRIKSTGFDYRRTYKIRASFREAARVAEIECVTDSRWKDAELRIELAGKTWDARLEARNAHVVSVEQAEGASAVAKVRYADNPDRLSPDRGHVIVRNKGDAYSFAFFIDDVIRDGVIQVRDLGAFVSDASRDLSRTSWRKPADAWDATVMETVAGLPEQTIDRATTEIPPKWVPPAHFGLPNLRQEISIDDRSQVYTEFRSLRGPGPDRDRAPNLSLEESERNYIRVTRVEPFAPPGPKRIQRWLEEGYLPVIHSRWEDDGMAYHQTVFATALDAAVLERSLAAPPPTMSTIGSKGRAADFGTGLRGDEPVVGLCRLEIENPAETERTATVWLKISRRPPMNIDPDGLLVLDAPTRPLAAPGLTPVWGLIDIQGQGELAHLKQFFPENKDAPGPRDAIRYTLSLPPHAQHAILLKVPHVEQLDPTELAQLRALEWGAAHRDAVRLWKRRLARAVETYQVPDPALMNLYRANLWHVLITTDRDPPTGLYEHGAGTYDYPVYANETMMVVRSLEMRGEHEEARRLFEPMLVAQGARGLPGNFKSREGLLYAAAPPEHDHYTAQGYNMHHGFILWAAAEHYLWTRDRRYLDNVAPNLVAACDWITRERRATQVLNPDGSRPIEWGLAPAGDLEDVEEYLYWYATNAYYYLGMKTAADVLSQIDHPDAARLHADAAAYARDILASVRESAATSPVVRLLDGTYVPFVPPRADALTDRKEGWIREALYCALHLVDAGLVPPDDPLASWVLHGLEDRIFMSSESGYGPEDGLTDPRTQFFSYGGFNPQPNLLDNSIAYLKRGQVPNFLRAFWNTYGISIYPDVQCFAESVSFGMGGSPLYKTPDECKFIQWMRQMLVLETGDVLHLAPGVPRAWMEDGKVILLKEAPTYFGPLDMKIESASDTGRITADLSLPTRNPPKSVVLHLRHPNAKPIQSVTINANASDTFDPAAGTITLPADAGNVTVVAAYATIK